ncbi:MAG: hypothetical protein LBJ07_00270 [Actinomycetes bacterium]|jgi:hypothetical protein|nr:hypothetical protein [Actinomycetes bacterium]
MALALVGLVVGCQATDIIGNRSVDSFAAVLAAMPEEVDQVDTYWTLEAPDGQAALKLPIEPSEPIVVVVDAAPFIDAGLQIDELESSYEVVDGRFIQVMAMDMVDSSGGNLSSAADIKDAYRTIVRQTPERIGHHAAMDHFGIDLDNGNAFEFAQDMATNEADMVFALNPEPFRASGVDVEHIDGWKLSMVETMDMSGAMKETEKLLKIFDVQ